MNPFNPGPFTPTASPPPWAPVAGPLFPPPSSAPLPPPPFPPSSSAFWDTSNVRESLKSLHDTFSLAKALEKELEMINKVKNGVNDDGPVDSFKELLVENRTSLESHESLALDAANELLLKLRIQLEPFLVAADEKSPWEEKCAVVRYGDKLQKHKRNKLWRKRKRKQIAEKRSKEQEQFEKCDKEADEWRARQIAKEVARGKVEEMKRIAKHRAKEEKQKLGSDLEVMLIVEKLQELRSLRVEKLKKQGHFLPEEDNKFLERVRAAVEEEERLALVGANTDAAKDAIATAEVSRISSLSHGPEAGQSLDNEAEESLRSDDKRTSAAVNHTDSRPVGMTVGQSSSREYDYMANLPREFYHYYYGGQTDMGTLIEVRRAWDAHIRPGGSRIPSHWVQPPPPSDEIWASYLVKPR